MTVGDVLYVLSMKQRDYSLTKKQVEKSLEFCRTYLTLHSIL